MEVERYQVEDGRYREPVDGIEEPVPQHGCDRQSVLSLFDQMGCPAAAPPLDASLGVSGIGQKRPQGRRLRLRPGRFELRWVPLGRAFQDHGPRRANGFAVLGERGLQRLYGGDGPSHGAPERKAPQEPSDLRVGFGVHDEDALSPSVGDVL